MYGQIAGAGFTAGVPAALAFTGVTSAGFALVLGAAGLMIAIGIAALRHTYRDQ